MNDRQKLFHILDAGKTKIPRGETIESLVADSIKLRGVLLDLAFLRKFFGDKAIGYTTKETAGIVVNDQPIPMWMEGARTAVLRTNLIDFYWPFIAKKYEKKN